MEKFYKVKIKMLFEMDNGKLKKKSEEYLVKSTGCTEAEAAIVSHFESTSMDYEVASITETRIVDVI